MSGRFGGRLKQLEKVFANGQRCPRCRMDPIPIYVVYFYGRDGEPLDGPAPAWLETPPVPRPCPKCGRVPEVFQVLSLSVETEAEYLDALAMYGHSTNGS